MTSTILRRATLQRPSLDAISSTASAFGSSINSRLFWVAFWNKYRDNVTIKTVYVIKQTQYGWRVYLWRLIDGSHLSSDTQRDVFVLGVSPIQVTHPLVTRLPPEIQEAVSNGVIFKHDVVHMSVFLGGQQLNECNILMNLWITNKN